MIIRFVKFGNIRIFNLDKYTVYNITKANVLFLRIPCYTKYNRAKK